VSSQIPHKPSLIWVNQFAALPGDGGGTRHFELGRELVRRGWRVTILASDLHLHRRDYTRRKNSDSREEVVETLDGVEIRWLWAASYRANNWRRAWNWLSFGASVRRAMRKLERPDVIIGSSPQLFAARAAWQAARARSVPFVFEVRDLWPESLIAIGGRKGPGYRVLEWVANKLYRVARQIVVLTRGTRDYLVARGIPAPKLVYVPNGVDIHAVAPPDSDAGEPVNSGYDTFVYAGAHGPANGLDCVLDAAELLRDSPKARFLLIGDGPIKDELAADAARRGLDNVEFRGAVSKPELTKVLQSAAAGLMVLRDSPLFAFGVSPNKLFDYLAVALPVVCNVPGEVAGMVKEAGAGFQAADTSGAALADAVRRLMVASVAERKRMGAAGRVWVEREHSREVLGARLDGFLRQAARTKGAS
jgi:glycosyltransferase involved in cell wall biosynthesis